MISNFDGLVKSPSIGRERTSPPKADKSRPGVRVEPFEFTSKVGRGEALSRLVKSPKRTFYEVINFRRFLISLLIILFCFTPVLAGESVSNAGDHEGDKGHKLALFGGNTQDGSKNGLSIGLEYQYRFHKHISLGISSEYAGGDFDAWVINVPFLFHPYAGLFFRLAPGFEIEDGHTSLLIRTGVGYDFELSPGWSLAPEFNIDFIEGGETKLIYGFSLVREF